MTKELDCKAFLESETRGRLGLSMGLALAVRLYFNTSSNSSRRLVDSRNNLLRKKKVHQVLPCHLRRGPISVRLDHCNSRKSIWTSPFSRVTPCLSSFSELSISNSFTLLTKPVSSIRLSFPRPRRLMIALIGQQYQFNLAFHPWPW